MTTPEGWTVAHQIGHLAWTDPASLAAINDPSAFAEGLKLAAANPEGYTDEGAEEMGDDPAARAAAALARRSVRARRRPDRVPAEREDPLVRPADEPDLDGDGPDHGDLGAQP